MMRDFRDWLQALANMNYRSSTISTTSGERTATRRELMILGILKMKEEVGAQAGLAFPVCCVDRRPALEMGIHSKAYSYLT